MAAPGASASADPLRDAKAIVEKVEQMVEVLKALGPRLREEVDAIEAKSTHTLELLKRGLSAEKLKSLAQFEAQAKAELEAAKKVSVTSRQSPPHTGNFRVHAENIRNIIETCSTWGAILGVDAA